jgi:hypothetical protein
MLVSPHVLFVHSSSHRYIILYRLLVADHVAGKEFLHGSLLFVLLRRRVTVQKEVIFILFVGVSECSIISHV